MKKILLFIATVFLTMGAMAQNAVEFTFTRNGNGADVEVNGKEGVTASITATSASTTQTIATIADFLTIEGFLMDMKRTRM